MQSESKKALFAKVWYWGGGIVGKERDHRILDPLFFGKNRKNSEKYFGKFGKILWKNRKNTPENLEKYFVKLGKILPKIRIPDAKSLFPTM